MIAIENSNLCWYKTRSDHQVRYDRETKTLLVDYEFPDVERFAFYKPDTLKSVAKTQRRELQERLVYGLALRVVFDLATITRECPIDQIALNGMRPSPTKRPVANAQR